MLRLHRGKDLLHAIVVVDDMVLLGREVGRRQRRDLHAVVFCAQAGHGAAVAADGMAGPRLAEHRLIERQFKRAAQRLNALVWSLRECIEAEEYHLVARPEVLDEAAISARPLAGIALAFGEVIGAILARRQFGKLREPSL